MRRIIFCNNVAFLYFCLSMRERIKKINWDAIGISTSVVCAIHCALLPLVLSSLPLFGFNIITNVYFEAGMILLAFCIGSYSLYHGYRKHHHSFLPLIVFGLGILLLVMKQFLIRYETWLLVPAASFIILAHILNYRSCRVHNHAHSDDCNHWPSSSKWNVFSTGRGVIIPANFQFFPITLHFLLLVVVRW